ncbi:MAG TPA: TIGR02452 family protein, partial [Roseiflexaceae bacterium]|nr:TIGR02452 family protein [Roseiflexaceae bacterium]
ISVTNEATLVAARRQVAQGYRVAALNFASARHPGGGWLSGAWAQEESLAHASGLVACIADDPMYARHERMRDALYTSSAIYSPDVPIFRDDDGQLLNPPYLVSFITAPAVNAGIVLERDRSRRAEVMAAMRERIARVLAIAAIHGHDALILGAWGCGVFKNDPAEIAGHFADALRGPFQGAFATVVFAVLDTSPERRFISPFERAFQWT